MLIWFHRVSAREWGRWSITKRKARGSSGGAIWVTEPRHHLTIILQYTRRHRARLCPCLRETCVVNTVTCKSGPFSHVKQILPFSPLISDWVQLHFSAFAQEPASCRNCSAFLYKETQGLKPVPCRPRANCLYIKQGPQGYNGTSHDAWKHIQVLQGEGICHEMDVPCGTCLHSQNSSSPDSVWGALNKTTSIA